LRVTAGIFKGRVLKRMDWTGTKPTTDMVRQAVCNYLTNRYDFEDCVFLDLFSGSGAVSLEFISRGAKKVMSVDYYKKCNAYVKEVREEWSINPDTWEIEQAKVLSFLVGCIEKYDVVWADPPYDDMNIEKVIDFILDSKVIAENGIFVLEHKVGLSFRTDRLIETKKYGDTILSFYK